MPLPNTAVIPTGWSAHHRPTVAATMTGTCTITNPGDGSGVPDPDDLDPDTGLYPEAEPGAVTYTGPCRVQVEYTDTRVEAAADQVTIAGYRIAVAQEADPQVGAVVRVTAVDDNGDETLVGRDLTVTGVARGTLTWERVMTCTDGS